jgi:antirestriction protein ArdC
LKQQHARRDHLQEFYDELTGIVLKGLEETGKLSWQQPWDESKCGTPHSPFNPVTKTVYKASNFLRLALDPRTYTTGDPRFLTFKNAIDNDWQVRKGSHGIHLIHWGVRKAEETESEDQPAHRFMQPHPFVVFHASDVEGIPVYVPPEAPPRPQWEKPSEVVAILDGFGVPIREVGEKAYYSPSLDYIGLPPMGAFPSAAHWSAVAIHEAGHATGAKHRLNRDQSGSFGSAKYAEEEMVAELLSLYVNSQLGLPVNTENHIAYLDHWIGKLKGDKKFLGKSAAEAQKGATLLLSYLPAVDLEPEPCTALVHIPRPQFVEQPSFSS